MTGHLSCGDPGDVHNCHVRRGDRCLVKDDGVQHVAEAFLSKGRTPDVALQVRTRTRQLRNLHETVDLLRQALHRLKLTAKLRAQLAAATPAPAGISATVDGTAAGGAGVSAIDLAKAAKLLADVGAVEEEGDMSGLTVLDADAGLLANAGQLIRTQADVRTSCRRTQTLYTLSCVRADTRR